MEFGEDLVPPDRRVLQGEGDRLVRLPVGHRGCRLPGEVRRARPQGGQRLADRRRAAAYPAALTGRTIILSTPACPPPSRSCTRSRSWAATQYSRSRPRHLHLPGQGRGAEPAGHQHPPAGVPERPDRLLRPRDRPADHPGRRRPRRHLRRAPHHPRPRHVGLRPGRLRRTAGPDPACSATFRTIEASLGDGVEKVYDSELWPDEEAAPRHRRGRRGGDRRGGGRARHGLYPTPPHHPTTGGRSYADEPSRREARPPHSRLRREPGTASERTGVGAHPCSLDGAHPRRAVPRGPV
ncbi:hypothetical protein SFUMM280S_07756 [Streptomyces fumanus]